MVLFGLYGNLKNPGGLPQKCPYRLALMEAGCSEDEAKNLAWMVKQRHTGKLYGLLTGAFVAYTWGHWFSQIQGRYAAFKPFFQLTLLAGFTYFGDYVYAGHRQGGKNPFSSKVMWNNNMFEHNREQLKGNFSILTRKFEPEEKRQFNEKRFMLANPQNRKWIYNEDLYNEEEFLEMVKRRNNNIMPWHQKDIIESIKANNVDKMDPERIIRTELLKPFDAGKHINVHQENIRTKLFKNYYPLD